MPPLDPTHPGVAGGVTAAGVALALADAWRPGAGLTRDGGRDLDVRAVRAVADLASTGEQVMASVVLALWGDRPVDLSRLDALDRATRDLLADAISMHAELG